MSQKSVLEQALLQVQTLEEAVKANAKGIIASSMKQELNDLLRESMEQEEEEVPSTEEEDVTGDEPRDDENLEDKEESGDEGLDDDNLEDGEESDDENPEDDTDLEDGGEEGEEGTEDDGSFEGEDFDDTLDMTGASDDEVLKVFKAMKPEDGIVVKKDGNKLEFSVDDNDYIIKLDDEDDADDDSDALPGLSEQFDGDDDADDNGFKNRRSRRKYEGDDSDDETIYEIELGEDDDDADLENESINESAPSVGSIMSAYSKLEKKLGRKPTTKEVEAEVNKPAEKKEKTKPVVGKTKPVVGKTKPVVGKSKEGDVDESARTKGWGYHGGIKSKNVFKAGNKRDEINEEIATLKKQNGEYKKALVLFKDKLNEVAVFNANLAFATRLFTEHSTTKQEKMNILKRFDSVATINESRNLYKSITTELGAKKTVTESVVEKLTSTPKSSAVEVLSEAKAYENPQFKRMKELMNKVK